MSDVLASSFELSVNRYHSSIKFLNANLLFQAIFNLIAFRLIRGDQSLTIPLVGITLSDHALHLVIPISLMVLWLQFGFSFHNIIKKRTQAWHLLNRLVGGSSTEFSMSVRLFEDGLLVDGWFLINKKKEHELKANILVICIFMSVTYFLLLGATNGSIIAVPLCFIIYKSEYPIFLILLVIFLLLILILSHVRFYRNSPNPFQFIIGTFALLFCIFMYVMQEKVEKVMTPALGYFSFQ